MAEPISFRSTKIEWKVKHFFSVDERETQPFNFSGSTCNLRLIRLMILGTEIFTINISRRNSNNTPLNDIRIKTFIEDRNQHPLFSREELSFREESYLWSQHTSVLRKSEEEILTDGVVTFVCELMTEARSEGRFKREVATQTAVRRDPLACYKCLSFDLQHLLDDSLLSDVTLQCGDRTIPAHRNILSARSDVFLAMLRNDMAESRTGIIEITDMEPSTLDQLVQYIYSGIMTELSSDSAQRLYVAADRYAIESLKTLCGNFMKDYLTKENVYSFLVLADAHGDKDLKDSTISFVVNTNMLCDEENWFGFHERYPKLAAEVLYHAFRKQCYPK